MHSDNDARVIGFKVGSHRVEEQNENDCIAMKTFTENMYYHF